ncbi:hypothetical protein C4579_00545 [Candidatus Microgenomates bacterium]|nr:MAG: hypothetical protein C4579_00545 [Candidatus Microgenomates bacterium]
METIKKEPVDGSLPVAQNGQTPDKEHETVSSEQAAPTPPAAATKSVSQENKENAFAKLPLKIKLALGAAVVILIAVIIGIVFAPRQEKPNGVIIFPPSPTPVLAPSFSPIPQVTSEFSKTEEFQQFENNIESLQTDVNAVEFNETEIVFPLLDTNITFGQ